MNIEGWTYYNHAAIPTTPPDKEANLAPLNDNSIWKIGGGSCAVSKMDHKLGLWT